MQLTDYVMPYGNQPKAYNASKKLNNSENRVVPDSAPTAHAEVRQSGMLALKYDERSIKCEHFMRSAALRAFRKWNEKEDKVEY